MRFAIAQLDPTVGDFAGNIAKLKEAAEAVADEQPDLLAVPELFLTGYPPRDLLDTEWFIDGAERAFEGVAKLSRSHPTVAFLVGTITRNELDSGKALRNSAVLLRNGEVLATVHKRLLPTYDVFDEARYFEPSERVQLAELAGETLGISICEDAWSDPELWRRPIYDTDPVAEQAKAGATLLINISASPFYLGKDAIRYGVFSKHAATHGLPFVLVNQVGGNDELVFDGRSMCVSPDGGLMTRLPAFEESVRVVDTRAAGEHTFSADDPVATLHDALVLGLRDYAAKCGFRKATIGLSGGIDSAVVCALAAEALGPENVTGVTMPSRFSSGGSVADSLALGENLGVTVRTVGIAEAYDAYVRMLQDHIPFDGVDVTLENIQARIRGNILMAFSNREGSLVLSTGNKSELAVGYCTLYGDMTGGLAVISDVPKTMVYKLAHHINRDSEKVPRRTIDKPPSAELRPDQLDTDSLPEYETLDAVLSLYVDHGMSVRNIVARGHDEATVEWIVRAVNGNEYKRRQAAPGLKVTSKAFGSGRRMPLAARYRP